MPPPARPARPGGVGAARSVLLGIVLLARGRRAGLDQFGDTGPAFLSSLAPLIAFPLVGGALSLMHGGGLDAIGEFLATICALLAPPVLSHLLARLWHREAQWLRYATAFNWCQWAIPMAAAVLLLFMGVLMYTGLPDEIGAALTVILLCIYGLWLHWFIARHGLDLSSWRAALLVVAVNMGTVLLVLGPRLVEIVAGGER